MLSIDGITRVRLRAPGSKLKYNVHVARLIVESDAGKHEFSIVERSQLLAAIKALLAALGDRFEIENKLRYSLGAAAWVAPHNRGA